MSGCYLSDPHAPHSWRDGPDEAEWCDGSGDPAYTDDELEALEAHERQDAMHDAGGYL